MKNIYLKEKVYLESEIYEIADRHNLSVTDCLKDDNEITVALDEDAEPSWEFELIEDEGKPMFRLRWSDFTKS